MWQQGTHLERVRCAGNSGAPAKPIARLLLFFSLETLETKVG